MINKTREPSWFLFQYEQSFDPIPATIWMQKNWHQSIFICLLYLLVIFSLQAIMKHQKALELRKPLIIWNTVLALFSCLGAIRTIPDLISHLQQGFTHSICDKGTDGWGPIGLWTVLFVFSKPVELIDTLFLVLRKRPLIFLHWYHHVSVMIYSWHASKDHPASGRWFVTMNFLVHAVMYLYYALRASGQRFPVVIPMVVTTMQLMQMFIGCYVTVSVFYIRLIGEPCQQCDASSYFALFIYFTYLLLFLNFFREAYISRKVDKREKKCPKTDDIVLKATTKFDSSYKGVVQRRTMVKSG